MNGWKYVTIGDVCTVERGGSPRPIDKFITDDPNGINWIKIGDTSDSMYITSTEQKIIPDGMKKSRYVRPGDFLLSNSMSFGRPYILKIDGCIHDGWLVLRDNNNIFNKRFLYYYLSAPSTYRKFENMAVGGVVNNLNSEMVRGVTVPVPRMDEQLEIVSILDAVGNLISLRKQQLSKLDELVKARFVELFGTHNSPKCDVAKLSSIAKYQQGTQVDMDKQFDSNEGGRVRFLRIIDYTQGNQEPRYVENKGTYITSDVVCIVRYGTVGFVCKGYEGILANNLFKIDLQTDRMTNDFLYCALKYGSFEDDIKRLANGATMAALSFKIMDRIDVVFPELGIQSDFLTFVEQTDKSKFEIQKSLEKLETLKKALMQKYFG